jgi:hypothetical protein
LARDAARRCRTGPAVGLPKALDKVKQEDHILDARR